MAVTNKSMRCRGRVLEFGRIPLFMGIVNVTPDSFSDGGLFFDPERAAGHAGRLLDEGAAIVDLGGESTRPGSQPVSPEEEIRRVVPVVEKIRRARPGCFISVDTRHSATARAVLEAGADIINDVSGLRDPAMAATVAEFDAGLVIMHMRGTPVDMQSPENLIYDDVIREVCEFLGERVQSALDNHVKRTNILIDPGIGFSKNLEANRQLIGHIDRFRVLGLPLLAGPCRKKFIGQVLEIDDPAERIFGTAGVAAWLAAQGVEVLRVHDVRQIREAVAMFMWCGGK